MVQSYYEYGSDVIKNLAIDAGFSRVEIAENSRKFWVFASLVVANYLNRNSVLEYKKLYQQLFESNQRDSKKINAALRNVLAKSNRIKSLKKRNIKNEKLLGRYQGLLFAYRDVFSEFADLSDCYSIKDMPPFLEMEEENET